MKFIAKALVPKHTPTSSEKPTEKKTNTDRTPLKETIPRVKQNISLGAQRREHKKDYTSTPSNARHRLNVELELPRYIEENPVSEKQDHESPSSEASDDPNIIRVPDYIAQNLQGSEPLVHDRVAPSATGEDQVADNPGNAPTESSDSINSGSNSNSERSLSHETRAKPPRRDPIQGRRQPANLFDPRRQNYQKNNKAIDDVDIFSMTAKNKEKISAILPHLPPGMNLNGRGIVFGSHVHMMTPSNAKLPNMPFDQALSQELTAEHLTATLESRKPREIAGIKVVNACNGDYHRTMYKFPTGDGNFAELPWPSPAEVEARYQEINKGATDKDTVKENLRKEQIARQVRTLVQDDNATNEENNNAAFVISSLLHQGISTALSVTAFGENPAFKMLSAQATEKIGRQMTIKDKNGNPQPQKIAGLGNITFTLSRRGDDFIIAADLPMYGEARPGRENHVPLHVDGVIGIHAKTEMIVTGANARNGELVLRIPDGVHVAYSGGLTF